MSAGRYSDEPSTASTEPGVTRRTSRTSVTRLQTRTRSAEADAYRRSSTAPVCMSTSRWAGSAPRLRIISSCTATQASKDGASCRISTSVPAVAGVAKMPSAMARVARRKFLFMSCPRRFGRPGGTSQAYEAVGEWLTKRCRKHDHLKATLVTGLLALAGCVSSEPLGGPLTIEVAAPTPRAALQQIASGAARCWTSGDIARYTVIPELDTGAGTPRLLVVERGQGRGLPQLVIEGAASPTRLRSYGPLASTSLSNRINDDVIRWSTGQTSCGARA